MWLWGYHCYNAVFSSNLIGQFYVAQAEYSFPSGDAFLVYPGPDGEAYSSLRAKVQLEGLQDLRALQKLEEKIGRERVLELIYEEQKGPFTFRNYPADAGWLYRLRERIAEAL